jgi:hypothetical protein
MFGSCIDTSVHQLSDWCLESVWTQQYTSYQTDVCSLYGDISIPVVRMMFWVCMETFVHKISDWYEDSVWTLLYTRYQTNVWSQYGDICTQIYQTYVWSLYGDICTKVVRLMCGDCVDTFVDKLSDWCVESVWRYLYTRYQTYVYKL